MLAALQPQPSASTSSALLHRPTLLERDIGESLTLSLHLDSSFENCFDVLDGGYALLEDPTHPARRVEPMDTEAAETEPSVGGEERMFSNMQSLLNAYATGCASRRRHLRTGYCPPNQACLFTLQA